MTKRVDTETLLCHAHEARGCIVCMIDDFHDYLDEAKEKRAQLRRERLATPINERFDLGGES